MRVTVRPILDPGHEMDVTRPLIAAIADQLWRRYGGNDKVNWLEAELHLECLMGQQHDGVALPGIVLEARASTRGLQERLRRGSAHARPGVYARTSRTGRRANTHRSPARARSAGVTTKRSTP